MESKLFRCDKIYDVLEKEYFDFAGMLAWSPGFHNSFSCFIKHKDMGILYIQNSYSYKVVDHKKWMLAKLKYGF